ncbi:MAG: hypothetical protein COA53_11460 [Rhodobacteraceae bacterium]|nr:MAG: hypothetical protein COA53_11460 [Paracoccaceae bacterium]
MYNPTTCHIPLLAIFAFGELLPNQCVEGPQAEHKEMVETRALSKNNRSAFDLTSPTTQKEKLC